MCNARLPTNAAAVHRQQQHRYTDHAHQRLTIMKQLRRHMDRPAASGAKGSVRSGATARAGKRCQAGVWRFDSRVGLRLIDELQSRTMEGSRTAALASDFRLCRGALPRILSPGPPLESGLVLRWEHRVVVDNDDVEVAVEAGLSERSVPLAAHVQVQHGLQQ